MDLANTYKNPLYAPWSSGAYTVAPDLEPLERSGRHGAWDCRAFQIGEDWARYRENYRAARADDLTKYHGGSLNASEAGAVHRFLAERLVQEYPDEFSLKNGRDRIELRCALTGDILAFDSEYAWRDEPAKYASGLDALAAQVPEDIAVMRVGPGGDELAAAHVCAPSHWDPREKIGKSFVEIHQPVAGIEKINTKAAAMMRALAKGGAFRRYGWSVTVDDRLNHHPEPPRNVDGDAGEWSGKNFDPSNPALHARVERQVLAGVPDVSLVLFFIRVYTYDVAELPAESRRAFRDALASMSPETIAYKGLEDSIGGILDWLAEDR